MVSEYLCSDCCWGISWIQKDSCHRYATVQLISFKSTQRLDRNSLLKWESTHVFITLWFHSNCQSTLSWRESPIYDIWNELKCENSLFSSVQLWHWLYWWRFYTKFTRGDKNTINFRSLINLTREYVNWISSSSPKNQTTYWRVITQLATFNFHCCGWQ